ncbi:MAG: 3-phosphoshikimate 1-carboxyvinyltransferase [Myxococcales bacterium]|nr:3-phosphoshikimate 1-carboxyvinyltransferase [Myxococcales bacterium]
MSGALPISPLAPGRRWTWPVPGSKSITNRAFVLAALAEGTTRLSGVLESDDTRYMRLGLEAMGVRVRDDGPIVQIDGGWTRLRAPREPLFVGNSGTTVRFLAALAALVPGQTTLVGDEHMAKRPIADLVDGLRQLGVSVTCASGCPPLTITGGLYGGSHVRMRGDRSSQYFTALLLMGGLCGRPLRIEIEGPLVSRPYVEMTIRMLEDFGAQIDTEANAFVVHPVEAYRPLTYAIEPDASAASYPFALAAAGRHDIVVELGTRSLQGDYGFVDVLAQMGAEVERTPLQTRVRAATRLRGVDVDMHHISDTVMTLAAIAPLAEGPTTIRNVANIRIKETDRLLATVTELRRLGQDVEMGSDWLRVNPRPLTPATIDCYSDHRMAMSFAVLGSVVPGVTIADPACVSKTYPRFWDHLADFGARAAV